MPDGNSLPTLTQAYIIKTSGGLAKNLAATWGAAQGECLIGAADRMFLGVAQETVTAANKGIALVTEGEAKFVATDAINRLTSSLPTVVVMADSGKVKALPASAGTYYRVGYMANDSADAGADGDLVTVHIDRGIEVVAGS